MLDTNIVSFAMRDRPPRVLEKLSAVRPSEVCVSAVTLAELRFGAARSQSRARYERLIDLFLSRIRALPFDSAAAVAYGDVRASLEATGRRLGELDMLIAGHAVATGTILVTNNVQEFARVAALVVEDWST